MTAAGVTGRGGADGADNPCRLPLQQGNTVVSMAGRSKLAVAREWLLAPPTGSPLVNAADPRVTCLLRWSAGISGPLILAALLASVSLLVTLRDDTRELRLELRNISTSNQEQGDDIKSLEAFNRANDLKIAEHGIRLRALEAKAGLR